MSNALLAAAVGIAAFLARPGTDRIAPGSAAGWARVGYGYCAVLGVVVALAVRQVSPVLVLMVAGVSVAGLRVVRRKAKRRVADRRRGQVIAACEGLRGDLAAGSAPVRALGMMAEHCPELRVVADAALVGADVPAAFRSAANLPGAELLRLAAAAWAVAERSGAGLAASVELAVDAAREERRTARVVATELAAALATARLLALLPLGILILGRGMGGSPFTFLLQTSVGQGCLALGLVIEWAGSLWLERIADEAASS